MSGTIADYAGDSYYRLSEPPFQGLLFHETALDVIEPDDKAFKRFMRKLELDPWMKTR